MDSKYEIIIYWSNNDSCFWAVVPELAGCMADGSSYAEALEKVQTVIAEWLETAQLLGREIPKPKGWLVNS
jgi:predicted RNase H-like HicB family nuclease